MGLHASRQALPTELYYQPLEMAIGLKLLGSTDQSGSRRVGGRVEFLTSARGPKGEGAPLKLLRARRGTEVCKHCGLSVSCFPRLLCQKNVGTGGKWRGGSEHLTDRFPGHLRPERGLRTSD